MYIVVVLNIHCKVQLTTAFMSEHRWLSQEKWSFCFISVGFSLWKTASGVVPGRVEGRIEEWFLEVLAFGVL